jgi:hypothetical protein
MSPAAQTAGDSIFKAFDVDGDGLMDFMVSHRAQQQQQGWKQSEGHQQQWKKAVGSVLKECHCLESAHQKR